MKTQELYTALRKIELLHANIQHLEHENESLKKIVEEGSQLLEEAKKNDKKSKNDELHRQMVGAFFIIREIRNDHRNQSLHKIMYSLLIEQICYFL